MKRVINPNQMEPKELERLVNDAWLNLDVKQEELYNPIEVIPRAFDEDPHIFITWVMSHPYYLSMFCKEIMNVTVFPTQALILQELWNKRFPILLGSRGLSKTYTIALYSLLRCIFLPGRKVICCAASFRQSKMVFENCESVWRNAPLLRDLVGNGKRDDQVIVHDSAEWTFKIGESRLSALPMSDGSTIRGKRSNDTICEEFACLGCNTIIQTDKGLIRIKDYLDGECYSLMNMNGDFETPDKIFVTPKTDVYKITTDCGYSFKCSSIHQVFTTNGWKLAKDLVRNDWLDLQTNDYFPTEKLQYGNTVIDENYGWLIGLMISEGTNGNRNVIQITNTNESLYEELKTRIPLDWKKYYRAAYKDGRGWDCKECYTFNLHDTNLRTDLKNAGVDYTIAINKDVPACILRSPKEVIVSFLSGLFYGDGSCFKYIEKATGKTRLGIAYYSASEKLIDELQILLLKVGVYCSKNSKKSEISLRPQWMLSVRGEYVNKLYELLKVTRWKQELDKAEYRIRKPFIRKNGLRYVVSTSKMNRSLHLGTFDTPEECEKAFENFWSVQKPVVRVKKVEKLPEQEVLYDFHMPETHSFIGNGFIQHNSINRHVFENVVGGFGVVAQDPVQKIKQAARNRKREELGLIEEAQPNVLSMPNQTLISGTCFYQFNHFYEYFKKYRDIIRSRGDINKLRNIVGEVADDPDFDWRNYGIIRIPYDLLPAGYFDKSQILRSKVNTLASNFLAEYCACFPSDSDGFFKRSLIERCVPNETNVIRVNNTIIDFVPRLEGNFNSKFVIAIDPAAENDNCAIVVIELRDDHRRIVYCWTTNKKLHRKNLAVHRTQEDNYEAFISRKIRDIMKRYPTIAIAIDSQGGGGAIMESLHDKDKMEPGEQPIWPIFGQAKHEWCDTQEGQHIIHMINFASAEWLGNAYFNTKKDMEEQLLLFPSFDGATMGLTDCVDDSKFIEGGLDDSMEALIDEIEELKNELTCIIHTKTPSGRDQFTVPDIKTAEGKKAKVKKDRASALIMANAVGRSIMRDFIDSTYEVNGGFASPLKELKGAMYTNPWYSNGVGDAYDSYAQ